MIRPLVVRASLAAALGAWAPAAGAQALRDQLNQLFTFSNWNVPLRVGAVSPDGQRVVANDAFLPSAVAANGALSSFLVQWMTADAASTPLAATGGGRTFRFVGGVPQEERPTPGPIFGERATTLGRGTVLAGVSYTGVQYTQVRGVPMDSLGFLFAQANTTGANAAALNLGLSLDYRTSVTAFYATAGVLDRLDVGVVVPVVQARLNGASTVRVVNSSPSASGAAPGATVIGGTPQAPLLSTTQNIAGRATGVGDVALRAKYNLLDRPSGGLGVLADVRLATGNANNLLGSGAASARVLGVYSGRFGAVAPIVNVGYMHYATKSLNDAVLATVGADADVAPWATVSLGVIGQRHTGSSAYQLPSGANGESLTNIPYARDDATSASFGAKLGVAGARAVVNVVAPFSRGGPRPDLAYTFGVERAF